MKILKRILAVCSFCTLLTATNCFAVTLNKTDVTDNKLNCYRTYLVQSGEQNSFIENIDKEIEVFGDKYTYDSYEVTGGSTLDTIEINTTKKITSKTKNLDSIINQLETTISYDENGYVGEYILNTDNIQIKTNYNGFREDLIEETINYNGLSRNDLDFLPKQTIKDGITLDLLNIEWEVETTKKIGEYEGIRSCAAAKQLHGGMGKCTYGCIGFGDCVSVCEYNAISIQNGVAEVDSDKCKACSACVNVCPQNIITIEPKTPHPIVKCSNCDKGAYTRKVCKTGCIGCMKCMKVCEYGAITIENNLSRIDHDKCTGCMKCAEVCPSSILNSQFAMRNADRAKTNN